MTSGGESAGSMRASADRGACCGYGVCADICPEVFQLDDAGLVVVALEIVPPQHVKAAIEAAESCPQLALKVEPL